jgi:hypothetical protein
VVGIFTKSRQKDELQRAAIIAALFLSQLIANICYNSQHSQSLKCGTQQGEGTMPTWQQIATAQYVEALYRFFDWMPAQLNISVPWTDGEGVTRCSATETSPWKRGETSYTITFSDKEGPSPRDTISWNTTFIHSNGTESHSVNLKIEGQPPDYQFAPVNMDTANLGQTTIKEEIHRQHRSFTLANAGLNRNIGDTTI